jgi:hypothetical protein
MPSLFTPSGQQVSVFAVLVSFCRCRGGNNGPRATLFFPIFPTSLLFGNPKIHRVQQRSK